MSTELPESDRLGEKLESAARGESKRRLVARIFSYAAMIAGLAGTAGLLTFYFAYRTGWNEEMSRLQITELERAVVSLKTEVAETKQQVNMSRDLVERLSKPKPAEVQVAKLSVELGSARSELRHLTDAVGESPEKALALPLLRKDMDNLRDSYRRELDATQVEINRVYDQNKWFIGLMITMTLALVGLAVSNFLQLSKS